MDTHNAKRQAAIAPLKHLPTRKIAITAILLLGLLASFFLYFEEREATIQQMRELVVRDGSYQGREVKNTIAKYERMMVSLQAVLDRASDEPLQDIAPVLMSDFPSRSVVSTLASSSSEDSRDLHVLQTYGTPDFGLVHGQQIPAEVQLALEPHLSGASTRRVIPMYFRTHTAGGDSLAVLGFLLPLKTFGETNEQRYLLSLASIASVVRESLDETTKFSYDVFVFDKLPRTGAQDSEDLSLIYFDPASYRSNPQLPHFAELPDRPSQQYTIPVGDQNLTMLFSPTPSWMQRHESSVPGTILALGLGITALLVVLILYLARSAAVVERQVRQRTSELALSNRELSEKRMALTTLLEACPDAIIAKDPGGHWRYVNRSFLQTVGIDNTFPYQGLTDSQIVQRTHPAHAPFLDALSPLSEKLLASGQIQRQEIVLNEGQDNYQCHDVIQVPMRDDSGGILGWVTVSRDITASKRHLNALRRARERVQLLIENTATAIVEWDTEFKAITWNPAAIHIFGHSEEEAIGQHATFMIDPSSPEATRRRLLASLQDLSTPVPQIIETTTRCGRRLLCEWQNTPLIDDERTVLGVTSFITDVTERVKAEEALQKRDSILQTLANSAAGFLNSDSWEPDAREMVLQLAKILDLSRVSLVRILSEASETRLRTHTLLEWIHPGTAAQPLLSDNDQASDAATIVQHENITQSLRQGTECILQASSAEKPLATELNDQQVHSSLLMPLHSDGKWWGFLRFDQCDRQREWSADEIDALRVVGAVLGNTITKEKLGQERLRMEKRLLLAQKRESLGLLAGGIAHDFNRLLNRILGSASMARARMDADGTSDQPLADIEEAGLHAAALCQEMLTYSGQNESNEGLVSINILLLDTLSELEILNNSRITVTKNLGHGLPVIEGDAARLRQALQNILVNAVEAIGPEPGTIVLTSGTLPGKTDDDPPSIFLSVRDSGSGMDARTRDCLFDPFFTTKLTGRGLGLTTALTIAEAHGGTLTAESKPNRGATFTLSLPSVKAQRDSPPEITTKTTRHASGTVLVVESEASDRNKLTGMLEELGFSVDSASSAKQALQRFQRAPDKYRLVLLDVSIAANDGREAFVLMREQKPDIHAILTGGKDAHPGLQHFADEGLAAWLAKPITMHQLRNAISQALQKLSRLSD